MVVGQVREREREKARERETELFQGTDQNTWCVLGPGTLRGLNLLLRETVQIKDTKRALVRT